MSGDEHPGVLSLIPFHRQADALWLKFAVTYNYNTTTFKLPCDALKNLDNPNNTI